MTAVLTRRSGQTTLLTDAMVNQWCDGIAPADDDLADDWETWLRTMFPNWVRDDFAPHHRDFWDWGWSIETGVRPDPLVAIWPRGHAKTTSAQLLIVALGARNRRRNVLYVSATENQASERVRDIATLLESNSVADRYPSLGLRRKGKFGNARAWRRESLQTASGFSVNALGLDQAMRGVKIDEERPDFIVIDDIDETSDTELITKKKAKALTHALLPAGSDDAGVLAIQNMVLEDGIFAKLSRPVGTDRAADWLQDRVLCGGRVVPALDNLIVGKRADGKSVILSGEPTWTGMDLASCQRLMLSEGANAFLSERQHDTAARGAKIFNPLTWFNRNRYDPTSRFGSVVCRVIGLDAGDDDDDGAAWSAFAVVEVVYHERGPKRYQVLLREVYRGHWSTPKLLTEMYAYSRLWNMDGLLRQVVIEKASLGKALLHFTREQLPSDLQRIAWTGAIPSESKDARLQSVGTLANQDLVLLPMLTPSTSAWLPDFELELFSVPNSKYRDMTDAFAHAVRSQHVRQIVAQFSRMAG